MFKRKLNIDAYTNLIAQGTEITGQLIFSGVMLIQGSFDGSFIKSVIKEKNPDDALNIGEGGKVVADFITATNVVVSGKVNANTIHAEDTFRVTGNGEIRGATIYYRTLEIEPGTLLHDCVLKHLDHCSEGEST
jgi:cytoskeletal protein CcmA (bactofilin family)